MTNSISTTVHHPIFLDSGSYGSQLIIKASGDVAPTYASAIYANGLNDSINNAGTISGAPGGAFGMPAGYGVVLNDGTMTNTGMIFGGNGTTGAHYTYGNTGVLLGTAATGLTNQGTIVGGAGASNSQHAGNGGDGISLAGGIVLNEGAMDGGAGGNGLAGAVSVGGNGGAGVVQSGASLLNDGTIKGGAGGTYGGDGGAGAKLSGGSLTNDNTIYGGAGGSNTGFFYGAGGAGGNGVSFNGGTLTNAGTIAAGTGGDGKYDGASGDAVEFGAASGTLIVDPGAVFIGDVVADASAADMLVLASAAMTGTLSGLGSQFSGFSTLIEDAGANWNFTGSNTLEGTALIAGDVANEGGISGDAGLTVTGQLINDETISLGTGLTLTGQLSNKGTIDGGTGKFGAALGGNGIVAIYMNAGVLINGGYMSGGYGGGSGSGSNNASRGTGGMGGTVLDLAGGTVTNQSTIYGGTGGAAYHGGAGGAGVAMSGGSITNDQTITGGLGGTGYDGDGGAGGTGVAMTGGSLSNGETITGGAGGYGGGAGGAGVSLSAGTLTNNKVIRGGAGGVGYNGGAGGAGVDISGGSLANLNTIDGGAGGGHRINGGRGGAGIYLNGGTVTNQGTIAGGAGGTGSNDGAPGDAVQFGTASGTLVIDPSAVFIGKVAADASAEDVLVLASPNAVSGTLTGLGSQFTGFSVLDFTPNVRWTVEGSAAAFASLQSINNFAHGDTIVLEGFADNPADTTYVTGVGLELTDTSGNEVTIDIVEPAGATTANFTVTDPQAETTITYTACFAAGTRILCADGQLTRVEDLAVGTALERFDGTAAPIEWIGVRTLDLRRHHRPADVQPILITRGALGGGLPWRDLVVSPDHAMYLQGHLIPAKALLNGFTVRQLKRTHVTYYDVELPAHAVIFAEGAAAESYLESGNRGAFENGGGAVELHPDFANSLRLAKSCAPFVEDGPVVEAVRAGMLQRAAIATTDDPALSIAYDNGAAFINSRSAVPGEIFADPRDRRRLGVKVGRLAIGGTMVRLDHPELAEGWHGVEPDGRWTDGRAFIPSSLIPPGSQIVIELAAAMHYPMSSQGAKSSEAAC